MKPFKITKTCHPFCQCRAASSDSRAGLPERNDSPKVVVSSTCRPLGSLALGSYCAPPCAALWPLAPPWPLAVLPTTPPFAGPGRWGAGDTWSQPEPPWTAEKNPRKEYETLGAPEHPPKRFLRGGLVSCNTTSEKHPQNGPFGSLRKNKCKKKTLKRQSQSLPLRVGQKFHFKSTPTQLPQLGVFTQGFSQIWHQTIDT